jgi:hypothetical protein
MPIRPCSFAMIDPISLSMIPSQVYILLVAPVKCSKTTLCNSQKCLRNSEITSNQPQNSASRNSKRTPPRSAHRIPGRSRARRNGSKHRRAITHRRAPRHRDRRQTTRRAEPLTIKASARGLKPRRTSNRGEEPLIVPCCDRVNHSGRGRRWRRQRLRGRGDRGSGVSSLSRKEC